MTKTFRDALMQIVAERGVSLRSVAVGTAVSYEQLKKLAQNKSRSTNVDDAIRIANYFGMSLDEFIGDQTQAQRQEILDLYSKLDAQERELLLAAARGFRARALFQD